MHRKLLLRGETSPDKFSGFEIADASEQTDVLGSGAATIDEGEYRTMPEGQLITTAIESPPHQTMSISRCSQA